MKQLLIRKATRADLPILLEFEQAIIEVERQFDPTLALANVSYYDLAGMIDAPLVELLVAEINGEVIGSGYARLEESKIYLKHQRHAYLGFMYVVPSQRGQGVNQQIIAALSRWTVARNVHEQRLDVYHDNQAAIRAYEKAGFRRHLTEMRRGL
ncbi:GNAT family N-acetyltransferase [Hymenobacter sp. BT664]|uniref:GNAT family N-acetyltransferase n=1 Tax=Hymenobacter montanus TaxID=2771359 RepID=A0A927GII2_9BACT|nr:GNAT family N-acetyltransferase [Hymenobacter montanus]MBD2767154.1 GNAT family N-acetyltransferase [Hymenobacter montanus]